ncbi:unnamed protein product [Caenorhabditis sp. 36 PRJEB53466]|nr:unnamed protein product [Caenorhabditis sp. 36 PRJEB53466]
MRILLLTVLIGGSLALDCVQIPDSSIKAGTRVYVPDGAKEPVALPANFECTYSIKAPELMYVHVTLFNQLKGGNDMITVRDELAMRTLVSSRSPSVLDFYVFANTTSTFQVLTKSVEMGSKFRMAVFYQKMPVPVVSQVGNDGLSYVLLNDLQVNSNKPPQNVQGTEKIVLTIAESQWPADNFAAYYVIDGNFETSRAVYHVSNFIRRNFISSGNNLTVVGLDNLVSESSLIFSPASEVQKFDDFTGFTAYFEEQKLTIDAVGKRKAVTVISKDTNGVVFNSAAFNGTSCSVEAVTSPLSTSSKVLADFTNITDFPYVLSQKSFAIIVQDCSVNFSLLSASV